MFGFLEDAVDAAGDFVEDVGDSIGDAAESVAETVADVASDAGSYAGAVGGALLGAVDDVVLDTIDTVTLGAVDVDFDDGNFSVDVGIDGVADWGVSIGEGGVSTRFDTGIAEFEAGVSGSGFTASGSAGVDFEGLPYAEGHVKVSADGDVSVGGRVQGTIPVPGGILSGEASGGFVRTDEGWGAFVEADGTYTLPSGTQIGGGVQAGYFEDEHGSRTTLGVEGSLSSPGVGSVGGSAGYTRIEQDGNVIETGHAGVRAEGFGASVSGEADYLGVTTDQGSFSQWTGDIDVEGLDAESLTQLGQSLLGADNAAFNAVLGNVADQGALASLLGQLDEQTTSAIVGRLVGDPAAAPVPGTQAPTGVGDDLLADDVLGAATASTAGTSASGPAPLGDDAAFAVQGSAEPLGIVADGSLDDTGPVTAGAADPADMTAGAGAAPADEFEQQVEAADQIEDDMVDDMFGDLEQ